jgi:hypothetical protein
MPFFGFGSSGSGGRGYGRSYASSYPSSYANNESKPIPSTEEMERGLKSIIRDLEQTEGSKLDFFVDKNEEPTLYKAAQAIIAKGGMRSRKRRNSKTRKARSRKSKTPRKDKQ